MLLRTLALLISLAPIAACGFPTGRLLDPAALGATHLTEELPTGRTLHAYSTGRSEGTPIIFIHGTPGSASAWERYLRNPPPDSRPIAIDRLGFARSQPGGVERSIREHARCLEPLLDPDQPPAILVGHSLGGPIVAWAAAEFPDRVAGIVIVAGALDPDLERIHPLQHLAELFPLPILLPTWAVTSNRELLALEDQLIELEPLLSNIRVPVAIIHGTKDKLVPYANVSYMIEHIDNAPVRLFKIDAGDHFLPWNAEATIRDAIEWTHQRAQPSSVPGAASASSR